MKYHQPDARRAWCCFLRDRAPRYVAAPTSIRGINSDDAEVMTLVVMLAVALVATLEVILVVVTGVVDEAKDAGSDRADGSDDRGHKHRQQSTYG